MARTIGLIIGWFWTCHLTWAAVDAAAIETVSPEDVVQSSIKIRQVQSSGTNNFAVLFTYTETGARKMLAFSEAHAGQKIQIQVGDFLFPEGICVAPSNPQEYRKWEDGWLKGRTSKFLSLSKADAEAIGDGLKARTTK